MTDALTRDQWATVLEEADPTTYGEVLVVLQDKDLVDDARELLDAALDDGSLHEKQRGSFPTLAVDEDRDASTETADDTAASDSSARTHESARREASPAREPWDDADFGTPTPGVWPQELLDREQWMGHVDKKPFSPWADRNADAECTRDTCSDHDAVRDDCSTCQRHDDDDTYVTTSDCSHDARWKWGLTENYVDGETIAMAEVDERLDGRAFLQQPEDPYVYVDGDDVRDPETGDVHPAFEAILEHLGLTYADVSTSGAGVHAMYRGDLPDGVKQAAWQLDDEPWGSNDDLPSIEVYPGKRVCVATGDHVLGTPTEIQAWNDDVLDALLEANDAVATQQREDLSTARDDYEIDDYDPDATASTDTAEDIRDIFAALDRLDARRVADQTIVHAWNDSASTSDGYRAFVPIWGTSSNGTANIVDDRIWQDTGDLGGYGGPVVMALIDAGKLRPSDASPRAASGQLWWTGIEHLRSLGFDIPEFEPDPSEQDVDDEDLHPLLAAALEHDRDVDAEPVSALPIGQLDHLSPDERKRAAQKRGLDWPTTRDARDQLFATITEAMANHDDTVVDAPTSLGKTHTITSTAWNSSGQYDNVTGGKPVVHLSKTRDARDEAAATAADAEGVNQFVLLGRHEACPVAAGDHDPRQARDDDEKTGITMGGQPASEWLEMMCEGRGIPFSHAHRYLEEHNDQGIELPCCRPDPTTFDEEDGDFNEGDSGTCPAIEQWDDLRELRDSDSQQLDVIVATHNFAHVPGLRMQTNVVVDEEPDFTADLDQDRVRRAVSAYLQEVDAVVSTWEDLIALSNTSGGAGDAAREADELADQLSREPDREWYFEHPDAHTLAPALARCAFFAEDRANGRRVGKTPHEPPRLDAQVRDDDGWNREWVTLVMDDSNTIQTIRTSPDLSQARSVVGLDAHPSQPVWAANALPHIDTTRVLDPEERQLWRRYERGLRVVQVGDATRPLASGEYFQREQVEALVDHLRDEYGDDFQTAITTAAVEDDLQDILANAGVDDVDEKTMHYGEEKSRNDFADELIALIEGCIDPGDEYVLNLLAELDLDAEPETVDVDGEQERAHGRGFTGPDADSAAEILASVRENHTAQAAGRYARNPDDPDSHATVFVRTDAMPPGFADVQVSGVQWTFTDVQREIVATLRGSPTSKTARELADVVDCTKEHVRTTLSRLQNLDAVHALEGSGDHGATLYADNGLPTSGVADLSADTTNDEVWEFYTASLVIRDPAAVATPVLTDEAVSGSADGRDVDVWDWESAGSEPPGGGSDV